MEQFIYAVNKLSHRVMTEKNPDKLNTFSTALTDITQNTQRYTKWILENI